MTWLVNGMKKNNAITWCTDSSYHWKGAPKVSSAGWIAYFTNTDNRMTGSLFLTPYDAGYTEVNNWVCTQSITSLQFSVWSTQAKTWRSTGSFNNEGDVEMSERNLQITRTGSSCVDILWNIRNTRNSMSATVKHQYINSHMDKYFVWHQLSMEQNMIMWHVICDSLAKRAVVRAKIWGTRREENQLFPSEDATVFVTNRNLSRGLAKAVWCEVCKEKAHVNLPHMSRRLDGHIVQRGGSG